MVPVSAIATVEPVRTPSSASSSRGVRPESSTSSTPPGRQSAGSPAGTARRRTPWARQTSATAPATASTRRTSARYSPARSQKSATRCAGAGCPRRGYSRVTAGDSPADAPTRSRITSRAFTSPPVAKALARGRLEIARARPGGEHADADERPLQDPPGALRERESARALERPADEPHRRPLAPRRLRAHRLGPKVQEHARDVDLHGAHLVAGAAEARRERQRGRPLDPEQLRRQDRADGAGVHRSVRVAAGARVDG